MRELVAKKYVNALMQSLGQEELEIFVVTLHEICAAFQVEKFQHIIH